VSLLDSSRSSQRDDECDANEDPFVSYHSTTAQLLTSCEHDITSKNHEEGVLIPWNQVLDVAMISQSTVLITFEVHKKHDRTCHILKYLVGPCPAFSFKLLVEDLQSTFELSRRVQLLQMPPDTSSLAASEKYVDENCLLLIDVARFTKDYKLALTSNSSANVQLRTSANKQNDEREDIAIFSAPKSRHQTVDLSKAHSLVRTYEHLFTASAAISQYFRMLMYVSFVICRTSTHMSITDKFSVNLDDASILQRIQSDFENYELSKRQEKPLDEGATQNLLDSFHYPSKADPIIDYSKPLSMDRFKHSDVYNVQYLLNEALRWTFLLIMNSWSGHESDSSTLFSVVDFVIMSNKMKAPVASSISLIINGYYGRIGSVLDHIFKQPDDDSSSGMITVESLQHQLELVHFLLAKEPIPGVLLNDVLGAIGVRFSRDISVAKIVNEHLLLERFHDTLHDLIALYMKQIFSSERAPSPDRPSAFSAESMEITLPWTTIFTDGEICIGPHPESVFTVLSSFSHLWTIVPNNSPPSARQHVDKMNAVVFSELLGAYKILCREYLSTIHAVNDIFEQLNDTSFHLSTREKISLVAKLVQFLCTICNDIDRIVSTHIPTLVSQSPKLSSAMEKLVHTTSLKLAGVSWTSAEMICKTIFSSMGAMFLADLDDIQQRNPSAVEVLLASLAESLVDVQKHLMPFGYEQLLLSCENKVIQRSVSILC
jgi:hypothetical protein